MSVYANRNGDQGPITSREMLDALTNTELSAAYHEWMTQPAWLSN